MIFDPLLRIWFLVNKFEFTGLFVLIFLEEAGVPLPVPGDIFIANVGRRSYRGWGNFFHVIWVVTLATILGTAVLYWVARKLGRKLVLKYLRFLHINQERLDKMEHWFQIHGGAVLIFGRLTPGFRIITTLMAGFFKIPFHVFVFYTGLGSVIWAIAYFLIGRFLGRNFTPIFKFLFYKHPYITYPLMIFLAVILTRYIYSKTVRNRAKGG